MRPDLLLEDDDFVFARFAWRVLVAGLVVGLMIATFIDAPLIGIVLAIALLFYLASHRSVFGHVVVAASEHNELERIRERVASCLEWSRDRSRRVVVIAHSQGGFISHDMLTLRSHEERGPVIGLIGVGSGLKPIWVLRWLSEQRTLLVAWSSLAVVAVGEALIVSLLNGLTSAIAVPTRILVALVGILVLPIGSQQGSVSQDVLQDVLDHPASQLTGVLDVLEQWGPLHVVGVAVYACGMLVIRRQWRTIYDQEGLAGPGPVSVRRWIEFSSYHDPVGRMLLPRLPAQAKELPVAGGGNPIGDHVGYFSRASMLPWHVAGFVLTDLGIRKPRAIAIINDDVQARARRRRCLRGGLLTTVICLSILPRVAGGSDPISAVSAVAAELLGISIALSLVFTVLEAFDQRRVVTVLRDSVQTRKTVDQVREPVSRELRRAPMTLLLLLFVLCFVAAMHLTGYPMRESPSHLPLLALAVVVLAYLLAVGAGYRTQCRWLILGLVASWAWHLAVVPPVAHDESLPELWALPGVGALVAATLLGAVIVWLLRPRRLG